MLKLKKTALRETLVRPIGLTVEIAQQDSQEVSCKAVCRGSKRLLESILDAISKKNLGIILIEIAVLNNKDNYVFSSGSNLF